MAPGPLNQYLSLMTAIRRRLDQIQSLKAQNGNDFARAEFAAFHGRKVVEGIAFGCLVAVKNGLKHIPRDAEKQWNAQNIFQSLTAKQIKVLPNPSILRKPNTQEESENNAKFVVEGQPGLCLTSAHLIEIYQRLHGWLHEVNPYVKGDWDTFYAANHQTLWEDLDRLENMMSRHFTSIGGEGVYCTLRDAVDGQTKVFGATQI